jgi:hypothetical protein
MIGTVLKAETYKEEKFLKINYADSSTLSYDTAAENRCITNPKPAVAPGYYYYTSTTAPSIGTMIALMTLESVT